MGNEVMFFSFLFSAMGGDFLFEYFAVGSRGA